MNLTKQEKFWAGHFGKKYTERFFTDINLIEEAFIQDHGISRFELDREFLGNLNKNIKILEVGCNIGMKLYSLQKLGFKQLYGIDIQKNAIEKSKHIHSNLNIIFGSSYDIPFKDNYFDLVFTSGLLIHIPPNKIHLVMSEIFRCSSHYIWGWEYFSKKYQEVPYRGNKNLLWKTDFAKLYLRLYPSLIIEKVKMIKLQKEKRKFNQMFLLKKGEIYV